MGVDVVFGFGCDWVFIDMLVVLFVELLLVDVLWLLYLIDCVIDVYGGVVCDGCWMIVIVLFGGSEIVNWMLLFCCYVRLIDE